MNAWRYHISASLRPCISSLKVFDGLILNLELGGVKETGSSVSIVTRLRLDERGSIPGRGRNFSLLHRIQTGSGVHTVSYPMGTGYYFLGIKAAGA
jgi:hypothetical protein